MPCLCSFIIHLCISLLLISQYELGTASNLQFGSSCIDITVTRHQSFDFERTRCDFASVLWKNTQCTSQIIVIYLSFSSDCKPLFLTCQHVQRPLVSFGPNASTKLRTCPADVCKVCCTYFKLKSLCTSLRAAYIFTSILKY